MRRLRWLIILGTAAVVCWRFPLFHVVSLKKADAEKAAMVFDPAKFAETFWTEQLLPATATAVSAEKLLEAIQVDPAAAKKMLGKSGVGEGYYYFLHGSGQIISATDDEVLLNITGGTNAEVSLQAGLIFGNALRDGSGLINVNNYPNSQDFNGISEALNRIVETRIQPKLKELAGSHGRISFAGCAEVVDESTDLKPLKVVPILAELNPPATPAP